MKTFSEFLNEGKLNKDIDIKVGEVFIVIPDLKDKCSAKIIRSPGKYK